MICLSCTEDTVKKDLELIKKNIDYIDMVEVRVDFLKHEEYSLLKTLPEKANIPCILTFRKPEDGGVVSDSIQNTVADTKRRCEILSAALDGAWEYLDIEDDADSPCEQQLVKKAEDAGIRVIKSFHDFDGVPENLAQRMIDNSCGDRYIPKAAVMPEGSGDFIRILNAFKELSGLKIKSAGYSCTNGPLLTDYILVGMGAVGFPSRVMAGAWGGMLTFCSAGHTKAAPGHISPRELVEVYNYSLLNKNTRLYGIIGNPVMHTKSPQLHNTALRASGINAVYLPFETAEPNIIIGNAEKLKLDGLSVTVPYKKVVIAALGTADKAVSAIGACNTIVRDKDIADSWKGYNTDWKGFLAPLRKDRLSGRSAIVIGAGGAARSVVYALKQAGMDVTVINRTVEKARALAGDFGCSYAALSDAAKLCSSAEKYLLAVQTTSAGMFPDTAISPVPDFDFSNIEIAYDIIYTPEQTVFLQNAAEAGCRTINGLPMLKAQAAEQFFLFTGEEMQ